MMQSNNDSDSDATVGYGDETTPQPPEQQNTATANTSSSNAQAQQSTNTNRFNVQYRSITDVVTDERNLAMSNLRAQAVDQKSIVRNQRNIATNKVKETSAAMDGLITIRNDREDELNTSLEAEDVANNKVELIEQQLAAAKQEQQVARDKTAKVTQLRDKARAQLHNASLEKTAAIRNMRELNEESKNIEADYIEQRDEIKNKFTMAGVTIPKHPDTPVSIKNNIYSQSPKDGDTLDELNNIVLETQQPLSRGDSGQHNNNTEKKRKPKSTPLSTPNQSPTHPSQSNSIDRASDGFRTMSLESRRHIPPVRKKKKSTPRRKLNMSISKQNTKESTTITKDNVDDGDDIMFNNYDYDDEMDTASESGDRRRRKPLNRKLAANNTESDDDMDIDSSGGLQLKVEDYTGMDEKNRVSIDNITMGKLSLEDGDSTYVENIFTLKKTICIVDMKTVDYASQQIFLSEVVRNNVGVATGGTVLVSKAEDIPDTDKLIIEPDKDLYEVKYQGELYDYFHGRVPVKEGDTYVTREVGIPFRVVESNPSPYSITDINVAVIEIKLPKEGDGEDDGEDNGSEEGTSETTSNKPAVSSNTTKLTASALGKMKPSEALAALKNHNATGYDDLDTSDKKKITNIDTLIENHCNRLMDYNVRWDKMILTTLAKDVVLLQCFKMNILGHQTITLNEIKYRFGSLFFGMVDVHQSVHNHIDTMVKRANLTNKEDFYIFATSSRGRIGGATYSYMVGKTKKELDGYDSDGDDNDILKSCTSHFVKAHFGAKNHIGRVLKIRDVESEADVIIVCEKDDVIRWLIGNGVLSIKGVKVILGVSKGQGDYAYRATIHALHSRCTNEDGSTRIVPVLVIADCDAAGLVILEKYTKGPFALLGKLAWLGMLPSRVKNTLELGNKSPELSALTVSKTKTNNGKKRDPHAGYIKYLDGTDLFKREDFADEFKIVKEFHEKRGVSYPCSAMTAMGKDEAHRIINIVKSFVKNEPCDDILYINE